MSRGAVLNTLFPDLPEFVAVAKLGDIPEGEGRTYPVNGKMIAIFFTDGEYFAIDDACPHAGASLAAGWVEDGAVTCPWHAWRFCVKNGTWLDSPKSPLRAGTYPIRIQGDDVLVGVPPEVKK
ncbi:Rieske (2Fe-2S) protein [Planctomicrobium sp. SH668]|uniref:Rieske (2Fe-2S) protein n=1 Tax=Planctomicrobium sp. SH668 TaxID=3448126 RepID=UPI003F5BCFBE